MSNQQQRASGDIEVVSSILKQRFGERFSISASVREQHGHTMTYHKNVPPDGVVFAQSTEEVSEIVRICAANKVPIIPFGTGTSLEGQLNAPFGGISIDLSQMNEIVAVNPQDLDCTVQAGVTRKQLNESLRATGLFFPIDPGANASLGGMASTRASGTNAVRYGTMREVVLSVTAVMADGQIVRTARRAKKSAAGYDMTRLLVGSEGTLGIMTEITLRLSGIPEVIAGGVCPFETIGEACDATVAAIQMGIPVARIELLDEVQVAASNAYSKLSLAVKPTLFLEFHGSQASVTEQSELFSEIAQEHGGAALEWSTDPEERGKLWTARHDAYWACMALAPGKKGFVSDVCVPISRLAECVSKTKEDILKSGLVGPIAGHVGDGNFHSSLMVDVDDPEEMARAKGVMDRIVERALAMDGTCTGEHGVGEGKIKFLEDEHGPGIAYMKAIKRALDPDNIMNPGKMFNL